MTKRAFARTGTAPDLTEGCPKSLELRGGELVMSVGLDSRAFLRRVDGNGLGAYHSVKVLVVAAGMSL